MGAATAVLAMRRGTKHRALSSSCCFRATMRSRDQDRPHFQRCKWTKVTVADSIFHDCCHSSSPTFSSDKGTSPLLPPSGGVHTLAP